MQEIAARTDFSAALSVPTIDERAWRASEPHTPNLRARLEAIRALTDAGIRTGVLVAPLMPGINDDPAQVEEILRLATEAGASYITGIALHLRGDVRQVFFDWPPGSRLVSRLPGRPMAAQGRQRPGKQPARRAEPPPARVRRRCLDAGFS